MNSADDLQKTVMIPILSLTAAPLTAVDNLAGDNISQSNASPHDKGVSGWASALPNTIRLDPNASTQTNPLLAAASALTLLLSQLRTVPAPENFIAFSQALINAVREFDHRLIATGVRQESAATARYILCSALDEAILSTRWGIASGWAHRSLLRMFHNEANGGDRFFTLLDHVMQRHSDYRDLLELFHLCLALGFAGRFHLDPRGHDKTIALRARLFHLLYGGATNEAPRLSSLTPHCPPATPAVETRPAPPLKVITATALIIAIGAFYGLQLTLDSITLPVVNAYRSTAFNTSQSNINQINMDCDHDADNFFATMDCE